MRRSIPLFLMAVCLAGCAAMKSNTPNYRKMMLGDWTLDSISVQGHEGPLKITLFNEAALDCFKGSQWTLTRPNSLGTYSLTGGGDCPADLRRDIRWTIYKTGAGEQQFQFKRLEGELEPMDNNVGYRLDILSIDEYSMTLRDAVAFQGQPLYLIYTFTRP